MKIEGAIFDFDGTLFDSMYIWDTIGEAYLRSKGIEPHENLRETFKNMSLRQAARYYQTEYGLKESVEDIINGVNLMIERSYIEDIIPKDGVPKFLDIFHSRGVKMCIATATDRHLIEPALNRNGLSGYFSEIFTCSSVGHGKDEPLIYETALDFLSTPKTFTWVFEDAYYAVKTAKSAGFNVAGVYDAFERQTEKVRSAADLYITSFVETGDIFD